MYEEGRRLYTAEINAAVRGAKAAGATEIVVMDCHGAGEGWTFNSLIPEELDPAASTSSRTNGRSTRSSSRAASTRRSSSACTRWPARATASSRTRSRGSSWWRLRFNGVEVGETGINAALCGPWGCPVVLVTGDEASCREGKALLGDGLTTVAVKRGLGRFSARQLPAPRARELIEEAARAALRDLPAVAPYNAGRPAEIIVDFNTSDQVERYRYRPGVEIVESRQIVSRGDDWWTAWRQFFF